MTREEALEYVNNMWMFEDTKNALETLIPEFGKTGSDKVIDYEEKYNEALERVRRLHDRMLVLSSTDALVASSELEFIFPELTETEDEKIRMALIKLMTVAGESYVMNATGFEKKQLLAYLEKQEIFSKGEGCYYYHADGSYTFIGSMGFGPIEDIKLNGERPKIENKSIDLPDSVKINGIGVMTESEEEDERIRKALIDGVSQIRCKGEITREQMIAYLEKQKETKHATDSKSERVIKAARSVLNNWLDGTDCPDVSGDFAELEYAIREYDGEEKQKEQKPIIQDVELNDAVYDYVRDHFIAGADFTPEYIKKLMENAFFAGVDYYLLKQESESCEPDTNVEKVIEDVIRVYGKTQGEWVGGYDVDTLIVNLRRAFNKKEQKPVDYDHEMWKNCEANFEGGKKEVIEHPEKYGLQKQDTRDADDLQLLGFIYDLLNEIEWKDNWAMSKDECLRRLNNYRPQKTADLSEMMVHKEPYLAPVPIPMVADEQKQEWSEEDENIIKNLIELVEAQPAKDFHESSKDTILKRLKSLCPQSQGTYKQVIQTIFGMLKDKDFYEIQPSHRVSLLNDIRVKCKDAIECAPILDEPSWKPSEEHLSALLAVFNDPNNIGSQTCQLALTDLYEQLKKL